MNEHIQYDFLYDNHFSELKEAELLNERLSLAATAEPYVGRYFSQDYLRRRVLRQTDQEIIDQDIQIKKEIEQGIIPDPSQMQIDPSTGQPVPTDSVVDLGAPIVEPDLSSQEKAVEIPKGGEI